MPETAIAPSVASAAVTAGAPAAVRLVERAAAADWRGPDPYDGLLPAWPGVMTGGKRRRQAIVQLHARAPVDVRPLYRRRPPPRISKTLGLFGAAALRLAEAEHETRMLDLSARALDLLLEDRAGAPGFGYPFDVQTRWSFYAAGTPNIVATSFAALALHDHGEAHDVERYRERARAAAEWTLEALYDPGAASFAYHPGGGALVHNANLLGARMVWRILGARSRESVSAAVERTLRAQRPDGSWPYGEGDGLEWADSFHTGYVLECLCDLLDVDPAVGGALDAGSRFYLERFFGPRGQARLWPDRPWPEDGHSAGTALTTVAALARMGAGGAGASDLHRLAATTVERLIDPSGAGVFRRHRWGRTRVRYPRWVDGHLALGLADAALASRSL